MPVGQFNESTLAFVAGFLAGAADKKFGTRTAWTMKLYDDMTNGKLDVFYLHRLEQRIARRWPKDGTAAPSVEQILRSANADKPQPVNED